MELEGSWPYLKSPPPVHVLSQNNLIHDLIPVLEDSFQYYPPTYTIVFLWSSSNRFPHQNSVRNSPVPICATCPSHPIIWSPE